MISITEYAYAKFKKNLTKKKTFFMMTPFTLFLTNWILENLFLVSIIIKWNDCPNFMLIVISYLCWLWIPISIPIPFPFPFPSPSSSNYKSLTMWTNWVHRSNINALVGTIVNWNIYIYMNVESSWQYRPVFNVTRANY